MNHLRSRMTLTCCHCSRAIVQVQAVVLYRGANIEANVAGEIEMHNSISGVVLKEEVLCSPTREESRGA